MADRFKLEFNFQIISKIYVIFTVFEGERQQMNQVFSFPQLFDIFRRCLQ